LGAARNLRFHWSPSPGDSPPSIAAFVDLCREAEQAGIESIHLPVRDSLSNALALAAAAGSETDRIAFRIGWDIEGVLESLLGRELLRVSELLPTRLIIHMSFPSAPAGHFAAAREFIANCRAHFGDAEPPPFDVEGESAEAAFLAIQHGRCLWRLPHRQNQVYADALPVMHFGKEAGLVSFLIARESRELALEAAGSFLPQHHLDDPALWITPFLWSGPSPCGAGRVSLLVGAYPDIASALREFGKTGISHFRVRELPGGQEMKCFPARVLPLVRAIEAAGKRS